MAQNSGNGAAAHSQASTLSDERSIAVLPFVNLSSDPGQAFLSAGVAEAILNLLANDPGIRATSPTSSFSVRGRQLELHAIALTLGVDDIVATRGAVAGE